LLLALGVCRFLLGYWFGGTEDQGGYVKLWNAIQQHKNPYSDTHIQVWPPLWWITLGLCGSLWRGLATFAPGWTAAVGVTYALKLIYYTFEIALALVLVLLALLAGLGVGLWQGKIRIMNAGLLLAVGLFTFAPTIGNQNFYFLLPWAFWFAITSRQLAAKVFLLLVSVNFVLAYIVIPLDLVHPVWFQWTYDHDGGHVARMASPRVLVRFLETFSAIFKLKELGYAPFIHLVMRVPVWGVMIWWFVSSLREVIVQWKGSHQGQEVSRAATAEP
jgi:hypothetical protein